ncbi:M17 family metallopeptidase [Patulibacter sp. SYSU D01012]|uniref:M17 family metallopeptidase n=1 Tax=Patulibacter sp. SYSU D01012 TaxID=2817381 RepID=UPI001B30193A|nr:M17 family metallopeptidase [Patulibacter sp. SYSU D01012]
MRTTTPPVAPVDADAEGGGAPAGAARVDVGPAGDGPVDAVVVGLTNAGLAGAPDGAPAALDRLVTSREARPALGALAHTHAEDGTRWIVVGLGADGPRGHEDRRAAAGAAVRRARDLRAGSVRIVADDAAPAAVAAVAEAAVLAAHAHAKVGAAPDPDEGLARIEVAAPGGAAPDDAAGAALAEAVVVARAANEARRLQQLPANLMTPRAFAAEAVALGRELDDLDVHVEVGLAALERRGLGLFAAVARGSEEPPALVTLRYEPDGASGPLLGMVGKAVTHDTGGYSLKTPAGMTTMKLDMSGGAAVLQAIATVARLRLPVRVLAVIGATENLVSGRAMKPGDVFTAGNGTTVEVTNTDAEGRLVLADAAHVALGMGAERLVDLATLTGGVVTALGTSHGGLMGRDDAWLDAVRAAGEATGERVWPLPLEDEHRELMKSPAADLVNSGGRGAHAIQGAAFLERFTGDVPWAHLDMAALPADLPRKYLGKGPSGWGVRLLVAVARGLAA